MTALPPVDGPSLGGRYVEVGVTRKLVAHVKGVQRCASVAACPLCAPVIREARAAAIDGIIGAALLDGCRVFMVTATVQHKAGERLGGVRDDAAAAWTAAWTGRAVGVDAYVGQVRAWDYTWSPANGWHPHIHGLVVIDERLIDRHGWQIEYDRKAKVWELGTFEQWLRRRAERFRDKLDDRGRYCDINGAGWHVSEVHTAAEASNYLAKVDGGWGAGLELARVDVKRPGGTSSNPWQILELAAAGDYNAAELWAEYERATIDRRQIVIGRRLSARFGMLDEAEASDEDVVSRDPSDEIIYRDLVLTTVWNRALRRGGALALIERALEAARALLAAPAGLPAPPVACSP